MQHKITVALVFFTVFSIVLAWSEIAATRYLDAHAQGLRTTHSHLLSKINSIPHPKGMERGIINSQARFVINTTVRLEEEIVNTSDSLGFTYRHMFVSFMSREYGLRELRTINRDTDELMRTIGDKISPYGHNLSAMTNFIEYSPRVDTTELNLGSADSDERMERLRNGLLRAIEDIEHTPSSKFHDQILRILNDAQSAQSKLESTGDIENFVSSFEQLQEKFIQSAINEYELVLPQIRAEVIGINQKL